MQKRRSSGLILLVGSGLLIVVLVFALQDKPYAIEAVNAVYAPMTVNTEEEGKTRVTERFIVTAPIDAYMHRITLTEGEQVKINQALITLEPLPSSIIDPRSRAQAEATLGAAQELEKIINEMSEASRADQELAEINFERTRELRKSNVVAQNDLDVAKAEKRRSDAVYRASQFASVFTEYLTKMSRSALDYEDMRQTGNEPRQFQVNSPVSGTILQINNKSERIVSGGEKLLTIGDLSDLEIETDVLSRVAVKLKPGMPVEILRWGGEQVLEGEVKRIEPSGFTKVSALGVEEQRVKVIVKINDRLAKQHHILDGFRVECRFVLWHAERVLQIPNSALFQDRNSVDKIQSQAWFVYVVEANRITKKMIQIGHRNALMAEVINGLDENQQVISHLSNELKDGMKVSIK